MTRVVDASVVVSALIATDARARWAEEQLVGDSLVAPHLLPLEVANVLRRSVRTGLVPQEIAGLALDDLVDLSITYYEVVPHLSRIWALRDNLSAYDAAYVALAEALDAPLATLDRRLAGAAGSRCDFRVPD
ncbi:MAG TPA: type II toxin-antitoxin system VapC family toxin [Nocardioides sp.]|nr:type II toxin-antitoxin system VapC family toxin [Nocardioides sp.]